VGGHLLAVTKPDISEKPLVPSYQGARKKLRPEKSRLRHMIALHLMVRTAHAADYNRFMLDSETGFNIFFLTLANG
jgi:hypothetical protein